MLGIGPFFTHKGDASQPHDHVRRKLVARQIAFDAKTLFAVFVEDHDSRSPKDIKAVKLCRLLFDIDSGGNELLVDEGRQLSFAIGFGFQPNTCASSGRCAEIKQYWPMFRLRPGEGCINSLDPVHTH